MKTKWGVSTAVGVIAFICTFFFSLMNNTGQTSLFRAGIGLILFFILGYLTMMSLRQVSNKKMALPTDGKIEEEAETKLDHKSKTEAELDEMDFQAIPLQALHNGENSKETY